MANPATHKIDRESVRLLAIQVGVREAARRLELKESTVKSWSTRNQWFAAPPKQPWNAPVVEVASIASKPGDILLQELQEHGNATKLSLAKSARHMAKQAETKDLKEAGNMHKVAQASAILHGWNDNEKGNGSQFTLNVLNLGALGVQLKEE